MAPKKPAAPPPATMMRSGFKVPRALGRRPKPRGGDHRPRVGDRSVPNDELNRGPPVGPWDRLPPGKNGCGNQRDGNHRSNTFPCLVEAWDRPHRQDLGGIFDRRLEKPARPTGLPLGSVGELFRSAETGNTRFGVGSPFRGGERKAPHKQSGLPQEFQRGVSWRNRRGLPERRLKR